MKKDVENMEFIIKKTKKQQRTFVKKILKCKLMINVRKNSN